MHTLLLSNNRISRLDLSFADQCPSLNSLILTNNKLSTFADLAPLFDSCKYLLRLSLIGNVVTQLPNYRLYIIFKMPSLRVLDFQKISEKERKEARRVFEGAVGAEVMR